MECISTKMMSVRLNECPTYEFKVGKGSRQGEPISPFFISNISGGVVCDDKLF